MPFFFFSIFSNHLQIIFLSGERTGFDQLSINIVFHTLSLMSLLITSLWMCCLNNPRPPSICPPPRRTLSPSLPLAFCPCPRSSLQLWRGWLMTLAARWPPPTLTYGVWPRTREWRGCWPSATMRSWTASTRRHGRGTDTPSCLHCTHQPTRWDTVRVDTDML